MNTLASICLINGFHPYVKMPVEASVFPSPSRFSVIFRPFPGDDWIVYLPFYLDLISSLAKELGFDDVLVSADENTCMGFDDYCSHINALSDDDQEPPEKVVFHKQDPSECVVADTEFWMAVGGPHPYSDSFTVSFYSAVDISGVLDAICTRLAIQHKIIIESRIAASPIPVKVKTNVGLSLRKYFTCLALILFMFVFSFFPFSVIKVDVAYRDPIYHLARTLDSLFSNPDEKKFPHSMIYQDECFFYFVPEKTRLNIFPLYAVLFGVKVRKADGNIMLRGSSDGIPSGYVPYERDIFLENVKKWQTITEVDRQIGPGILRNHSYVLLKGEFIGVLQEKRYILINGLCDVKFLNGVFLNERLEDAELQSIPEWREGLWFR